jgi:hypothetical protein
VRALDVASLGLWLAGAGALGGGIVWWALDGSDDVALEARLAPGRLTASGRF